jgi:ubiquitin-protein ligase E3 A
MSWDSKSLSTFFDQARILEVDAAYQMNRAIDHVILQAMLAGQNEVSPYLVLEVSRQNLIADTLMHLQLIDSRDLKKKLRIKFIGEDGIDAGGVQREFFAIIIRDLFNAQYGMFQPVAQSHCVWFNSNAMEECQPEYELIGKLLGLAIFNNVLLDIRFPQVVYKKLLRQPIGLDDLKSLDPEMWRGFKQLLDYDGDVAEVYDRTFTVEKQSAFGGDVEIVELKAGGAQIALTRENRTEYVRLYVDWILNRSVAQQYRPFEEGFWEVAGGDALRLFASTELELVICGSPDIDFHAMEDVAVYEEPLSPDHRLVTDFWRAVHSLEGAQKGKFLLFCTGSDRVPIQGLGTLKLTISLAGGGPDRLMSSHTCFNHVLLPPYATYESLRDRMLQSIENCEGFGLV